MTTNQKAKKVRKKLLSDFEFYAKNALRIRTKDGDTTPLSLNTAQQQLLQAVQKQYEEEGKIYNNFTSTGKLVEGSKSN